MRVNDLNKKEIMKLASDGKIVNILKRKKDAISDDEDLDYDIFNYDIIKNKEIKNGDIVERQLRDGDLVVLNRRNWVACNKELL